MKQQKTMIREVTMRFLQTFDCTDSVRETLLEEGRHDASDEEIEEMVKNQFEDHDFNKRAQLSMKVSVGRESAADTAQRVLQTIFDNTESFERDNIGSELAYVVKAILDSRLDKPVVSQWDLSGASGERHQVICDLFRECFDDNDVVWRYVEISSDLFGVWQPISTAPLDGTEILITAPNHGIPGWYVRVAYFEHAWINDDIDDSSCYAPSHWMPLPSPPNAEVAHESGEKRS